MTPAISTAQDPSGSTQATQATSANPSADRSHEAHRFFTPEIMRRRGMPMGGAHGPSGHGQASSTQGENASQGPLIYGGGSVMRDPTNYVIIWNPTGSTFGANYRATIEQYFKDIGDTPFMEINSQYGDSSGKPVPNTNHYGGTWVDTTAYPHAGTVADPLVGSDIQASVDRAIAANPTWQAPGLSTMYFVYLGENIIECKNGSGDTFGCFAGTDAGKKSPPASDGPPNTVKGAGTYCAYHFYFGSGPRVYATMPYASLGACYPSPNLSGYPNGVDQDVVLSPTSHEQFEAYSDPQLDAWVDAGGNENGDKCAYTYGQVEPDGTNFVLWGRRYQLQEQWSNQLTYGCIKRAGPGAQLTITGDLNFGTVARGSTATKDVLIQNTASGDLNLLNIRLGTAGSAFNIDPSSPLWGTLLSGESVQVKVNFSPSATASSTFVNPNTLVVDTDQISSETQSIATSASIGLPKAAVSGGLNFGTVCAGGSIDETITVTNSGQAPLTINSVSIGAGSTAGLSVLPNPSLPQTLPVGGSLTFTVRFSPTTTTGGPVSGSVVVNTDDPANPTISVPVTGTIGAANVTISSNALDFGGVATDNRTSPDSVDRKVTIGNTGSCALNLTSLTMSGTNSSDFSVIGAPTPPVSIANGSSLGVTIRFNPSAPGLRTATLTIGTSDPAHPSQSVALTGLGLVPAIQTSAGSLVYSPTVIQSQAPGYAGMVQKLAITNVGQSELIVDTMGTSGTPFAAPGPLNPRARYAPSDGFTEPVTFAPTSVGKFTGTFTVSDADPEGGASQVVNLCGEAVKRGIRVLAINSAGAPFAQVAKLHLQSHGTAQNININAQNLALVPVVNACMPAQMQYENQALPAAGTVNQRSSYYTLSVTAGGKSTTVTFTLDVAEFKTLMVTIK